jgi:hypothetical protein
MQIVKPLVLVLLTYSLLSCGKTKAETITTGSEETSPCGETLVGVTTEKRDFEVAGATLKDFSFGKITTKVTPEFQRIASEAAMNQDSRVKIACKATRMSGVEASPDMLSYYMHLLGFLGSDPPPTVEQRMAWAEKFPIPRAAPQEQATPVESPSMRLAKICTQPVVGLRRQPEEFVPIWMGILLKLKGEKFPSDRDLQSLYNLKGRYRDYYNTPDDFFSESLYTLKCLEDVGEIKLQQLGATGKQGDKVFKNQRIIFKSP